MTLDQLRKAIREACRQRGWSVMDLARHSEVSPEAIRRFLGGTGALRPTTVMRLAKAVGITAKF